MKVSTYLKYTFFIVLLTTAVSCKKAGGNSAGSEYMPDMAHSVAYEANYYVYYYNNRWGSADDYHTMVQPRQPVAGTIARGYAGTPSNDGIQYTPNGSVPYYYGDTEEERERASMEIIKNPFPITTEGLAKGKELYTIFCGICHGEKGDGAGYLVREDGGKYPVQPANLLLQEYIEDSNGHYYHAIMYGKNKMGAYTDKLSYEERWQVIHYIRSLQAKELKKEYNALVNTFNDVDVPVGAIVSGLENLTGSLLSN